MPKGISGQIKYVGENDPLVIDVEKCPVCGSRCTEDYLDINLTSFFFPG